MTSYLNDFDVFGMIRGAKAVVVELRMCLCMVAFECKWLYIESVKKYFFVHKYTLYFLSLLYTLLFLSCYFYTSKSNKANIATPTKHKYRTPHIKNIHTSLSI